MGVQEWGVRTWGGDNNITPGIRYIFETLFRILFPQKLLSTFFAQNWTWRISGLLFSSRGSGVVGSLLVCQGPPLPPFTLSLTQRPSLSLLFFFSGEVLSEHSLFHEYIFSPSLLLIVQFHFPSFLRRNCLSVHISCTSGKLKVSEEEEEEGHFPFVRFFGTVFWEDVGERRHPFFPRRLTCI